MRKIIAILIMATMAVGAINAQAVRPSFNSVTNKTKKPGPKGVPKHLPNNGEPRANDGRTAPKPKAQPDHGTYTSVLKLDPAQVTCIEIEREASMSVNGGQFSVTIGRGYVTRILGDPTCDGSVFHKNYDASMLGKAINLINNWRLQLVKKTVPTQKPAGETRLTVYAGEKVLYTLVYSPRECNVAADFNDMVNKLVTLAGGEPEDFDLQDPSPYIDPTERDPADPYHHYPDPDND